MDKKVNRIEKLARLWKGNTTTGEQVSSHLQARKLISSKTGLNKENAIDKVFYTLVFSNTFFPTEEREEVTLVYKALDKMGYNVTTKNCSDGVEVHLT